MPGKDGKLSTEETDKAFAWIENNWGGRCSCGQAKWTVPDYLIRMDVFTPGSINIGGKALGFLIVSCNNCANTQFFNAKIMGTVD